VPLDGGIADEDGGSGWSVDSLAVEREGRAAGQDDVDLLVSIGLLGVLLDDVVAGLRRDVGVDPEGTHVERPSHGSPEERPVDDRDRLDVVEANALPAGCHARDSTRR
jgi:hypothetical protein